LNYGGIRPYMVRLKANFHADWIAHLRAQMTAIWGAQVDSIADGDIPAYYFESTGPRLRSTPRQVKTADDFQCSAECEAGWEALKDKVSKGADLHPYLSKGHGSLFNADGLLAEWAVHHFHLGQAPDPKNPYFMERTGPLVFALVDDQTFCAINVFPHDPSPFEDTRILECIHRNWPDMVSAYRMKKATGILLSATQRRNIRKGNVNVLVATADGTVYGSIGGGVVASGLKWSSWFQADKWHIEITELQNRVEKGLPELMPVFERLGYSGESELEAKLRITEAGYQVFYPKYSVLANLQFNL
jgi:hypothetical protein